MVRITNSMPFTQTMSKVIHIYEIPASHVVSLCAVFIEQRVHLAREFPLIDEQREKEKERA